jgi:hypothetical protein
MDSKVYFPENTSSNFANQLSEILYLPGQWECALTELSIPSGGGMPLLVCCDVVAHSSVSERKFPVLRRLVKTMKGVEFLHNYYMAVDRRNFSSLRVYILNDSGQLVSFPKGSSKCTLHFRQIA